jgi:hypothetical protein
VLLSISDDRDRTDKNITRFKTEEAVKVLIVVRRCTLGFNMEKLLNIVDMSYSLSPETLFQQICRVVRIDTENPDARKLYLKLIPEEHAWAHRMATAFAMNLARRDLYMTWNGDWKKTKIAIPTERNGGGGGGKKSGKFNPPDLRLEDLSLLTFRELMHVDLAEAASVAWSSFREMQKVAGAWGGGDPDGKVEAIFQAARAALAAMKEAGQS